MPYSDRYENHGYQERVQTTYVWDGTKHATFNTAVNGSGMSRQYREQRNTVARPKPRTEWIMPTAYDLLVDSTVYDPGSHKRMSRRPIAGQTSGYDISGYMATNMGGLNESLPNHSSSQRNRAIIEALLSVKDQKVNFAQAYAERRMTANLLADSVTRIARSVIALRRGKWREAGRWLKQNWKQAPSSWLEYQYGWVPLMSDVYGSVELLKQRTKPRDWLVTGKGNVTERSFRESMRTDTHFVHRREVSYTSGHFVRVDYAPADNFLKLVSQLGLTNPALLAWELLPHSFVLDWAFPIGDWLSSLDATKGLTFYAGSITKRRELVEHATTEGVDINSGAYSKDWLYLENHVGGTRRQFTLNREVLSSSPLPTWPGVKDPLSLTHVANGLSLLAVALKPGPVKVR